MALTVTVNPTSNTSEAIGMKSAQQSATIQSDVSLVGANIYLDFGLFLDSGQPEPTTIVSNPQVGYVFQYPASATLGIQPTLINSYRYYQWQLFDVTVDTTDNFNFTINYTLFYQADKDSYVSPTALNNLDLFLSNSINAVSILDNSSPSIYNQQKTLKIRVVHDDGTTNKPFTVAQGDYQLRFWGRGLLDAQGDTTVFSYEMVRDGETVNNLSAFVNTTIRFSINGSSLPGNYKVGVARVDSISNASNILNDLEIHQVDVSNTGVISTISGLSSSAIISATGLTNVSGDIYNGEIEIDKDYFNVDGRYRIFFHFDIGSSVWSPQITETEIVSDAPYPATFGLISHNLWVYDLNNTNPYTNECFVNAVPRARIQVEITHNKSQYATQLTTNGGGGTWEDNFVSALGMFSSTLPADGDAIRTRNDFEITRNDNVFTSGFRIPDDWAGETRYILFVFTFEVPFDPEQSYTDLIYYAIKVTCRDFDENGDNLFSVALKDTVGDPFGNAICEDYSGSLKVETTKDVSLNGVDYSLVSLFNIIGEDEFEEHDSFVKTVPPQLISDKVVSQGSNFEPSNIITTTLLPDKFDKTKDYCFTAIAQKYQTGGGGNPAPAICPNLDVTLDMDYVGGNNTFSDVEFTVTINSGAPGQDIQSIEIRGLNLNNPQTVTIGTFTSSATYSFKFLGPNYQVAIDVNFRILITLVDGCTYQADQRLVVANASGGSQTVNLTLNP